MYLCRETVFSVNVSLQKINLSVICENIEIVYIQKHAGKEFFCVFGLTCYIYCISKTLDFEKLISQIKTTCAVYSNIFSI